MLSFSLVPQELKEVGKEQPKVEAELTANVSKNRYPHVLPCKCCLLPPAHRGELCSGMGPRWTPWGDCASPRALMSALIPAPWGGGRLAEHRALLLAAYMGLEELRGLLVMCNPDEIAAASWGRAAWGPTCVWSLSDDHSRVKLSQLGEDPHSDYINANFIPVSARLPSPHRDTASGHHQRTQPGLRL